MTNTKNNERKSTIKGFVMDMETLQPQPFEVVTEYTRSNDKARKLAADCLEVDSNIVIVQEIINEKSEKQQYNSGKVYDYCAAYFDNEEEARVNRLTNYIDCELIPFTMFSYECAFWAYDSENDSYFTDYVHDVSPMKFTKVNARQFMVFSANELIGANYEILAVHNVKREKVTYYAIINNDELEKCKA